MLEYINNLNFECQINKDELLDLFKTKSSDVNSIILSKIDNFGKISDFFSQYTNLDVNSITKCIDNINVQYDNILMPNSNSSGIDLEYYLSSLSTIIITIHYSLKLKEIICKKFKYIQQHILEELLNKKIKDEYKDKIIDYNSLSITALNAPLKSEISFSSFLNNKPKVFNRFNSTGQKFFNNKKEDPTPKFFNLDNNDVRNSFNKNFKKKENNKELKTKRNSKNTNSSSCSLISMSSILVTNKNQEKTMPTLNEKNDNKINLKLDSINVKINSNHKNHHDSISSTEKKEKKGNNIFKLNNFSEKSIDTSIWNLNESERNERRKNNSLFGGNNNQTEVMRKKSSNSVIDKEINNSSNKELFVELLKFANEIYKDKYIDEKQKKILKQLIIVYMASKNTNKK